MQKLLNAPPEPADPALVRTTAGETGAYARGGRLGWPPRAGTRCTVYLPDSLTDHRSEIVGMSGTELLITPPIGADRGQIAPGNGLKLLFPGRGLPIGVDAVLLETPRSPHVPWMLDVAGGPIPVERREDERVPCHQLVVIRVGDRMIPAHMLDRSLHGMRCAAGRGVQLNVDDRIDVEVDGHDTLRDARIVWQRLAARGLEFGLHF